jgi:hypothetical protein
LSVRSTNHTNTLEWVTPAVFYVAMEFRRRPYSVAPDCDSFPLSDSGWLPFGVPTPGPRANTSSSHQDPVSHPAGTTFCYGVWVAGDNDPISLSDVPQQVIIVRTVDDALGTGPVKWASTPSGFSALTQVGIGQNLVAVTNDGSVFLLKKGPLAGGFWASNSWPFHAPSFPVSPMQGRPAVVQFPVLGSTRTTFVGSFDGRVYALDADRGSRTGGAPW